ncbi:MAG: hypothetical protein ACTH7Q_00420 [Pseudoalteromonas sp.]
MNFGKKNLWRLYNGCTSVQMVITACDYVEASVKSELRYNDSDPLKPTRDNRKVNIINGVLNALVTPLGRAMFEEEVCAQPEFKPYWHDNNTVFFE